jgi:hypothetical protein
MKHKLDRKSLDKLYIGFIRSILEYGGIVLDNCSLHESELLVEAAAMTLDYLNK